MSLRRLIPACLLCLFYSFHFTSLDAQWEFKGCPESGTTLNYAVDGNRTFLLAKGELFYADNESFSWQGMNLPDTFPGEGKIFASKNRLYLFSSSDFFNPEGAAILYRTDDLGITWKNITPQFDSWGRNVNIVVHKDSLFISAYEDLLVSFNAGESYNVITDQYIGYELFYLNHFLFTYLGPKLYRSFNAGVSWDLIYDAHDTITYFDAFVVDQAIYRIESASIGHLDMRYAVYRSTNNGDTWEFKSIVGPFVSTEPTMMGDEGHLFFAENKYNTDDLLYSTDQGENWAVLDNLPSDSYEYHNDVLFCQNILQPTISTDYGHSFHQYSSGFRAAMVTDVVPGTGRLFANTDEELYSSTASHQWSVVPDSKSIAFLDDSYLVGYINNLPRRSTDGGVTWDPIPASAFGLTDLPNLGGQIFGIGNAFVWSSYASNWYSLDLGITWHPFNFSTSQSLIYNMAYEQDRFIILDDQYQTFSSFNLVEWENISVDFQGLPAYPELVACQNGYVIQTIGPFIVWLPPNETEWVVVVPQIESSGDYFSGPVFTFMKSVGNALIGGIYGRGVFVSFDLGRTWHPDNEGLDDFHTRSLVIAKDTLYLGVDGGVWTRAARDILGNEYSGTVFNDINADGIFDPGETGLKNVFVCKETEVLTVSSGSSGGFSLFSRLSISDIIQGKAPLYSTITTLPHMVTGEMDSMYIGVHFTPGIYDASVHITNTTPFQPGFEEKIIITYKNKGTELSDLIISYPLDVNLEFVSASIDPLQVLETFYWTINNVTPGESGTISIIVRVKSNVSIGTIIPLVSTVSVDMQTDIEPADNESLLNVIVVGSYDPNDKAVFPAGYISPAMIADTQRLEYTIRFQNTGNFPATFVRIQDTLSSSLDLTSLEILAASHDYTWKLLSGNVLDFYFENINLPDSTNDERGSHGFVKFAINAKSTLALNDQIENRAYIYFDFNTPVVTNTVGSTVGFETSTKEPRKTLLMTASPNPTKDIILVSVGGFTNDGEVRLSLYNAKGEFVKTQTSNSSENIRIDIQGLPAGMYFLQARTSEGTGVIKVVKN